MNEGGRHFARIARELSPHGLGLGDNGEQVETVETDFGAMDTPADELAQEVGISAAAARRVVEWLSRRHRSDDVSVAAELLSKFISVLWFARVPGGKINLAVLGLRVVALGWLLGRSGETVTHLAGRCRCSKQRLDVHVVWLARELRFHGIAQKRSEATESYAEAARASWAKLSPEERRARRRGKPAANLTPRDLQ